MNSLSIAGKLLEGRDWPSTLGIAAYNGCVYSLLGFSMAPGQSVSNHVGPVFAPPTPYIFSIFPHISCLVSLIWLRSIINLNICPPSPTAFLPCFPLPPSPSLPDPFASHIDISHTFEPSLLLALKANLRILFFLKKSLHPKEKRELDRFLQDQIIFLKIP